MNRYGSQMHSCSLNQIQVYIWIKVRENLPFRWWFDLICDFSIILSIGDIYTQRIFLALVGCIINVSWECIATDTLLCNYSESIPPLHRLPCRLSVKITSEFCWWTRLRSWPAGPMPSSHYVSPERYKRKCGCVSKPALLLSLIPPVFSSSTGGKLEQRSGAGERRGSMSVRPSPQLHSGGDRERRAVRCHGHRLLWTWPCHLSQPRWDASSTDGPVQLQMAQR